MRLIVATQPLPHNVAHMLDGRHARRECRRAMRYDSPPGTWRRRPALDASSAAKPLPTTPNPNAECPPPVGTGKRACGQHTILGVRVDSERLYPTTH